MMVFYMHLSINSASNKPNGDYLFLYSRFFAVCVCSVFLVYYWEVRSHLYLAFLHFLENTYVCCSAIIFSAWCFPKINLINLYAFLRFFIVLLYIWHVSNKFLDFYSLSVSAYVWIYIYKCIVIDMCLYIYLNIHIYSYTFPHNNL